MVCPKFDYSNENLVPQNQCLVGQLQIIFNTCIGSQSAVWFMDLAPKVRVYTVTP